MRSSSPTSGARFTIRHLAAALLPAILGSACRSPRAERARVLGVDADITHAFERPRDPFRDPLPADRSAADRVRLGYLLFTETPRLLGPMVASALSCSHCHLNAGQRAGGLALVGAASAYPAPSARAGRTISLAERIVGCLIRSTNAAGGSLPRGRIAHENAGDLTFPSPRSYEVRALAAYVEWLSEGVFEAPWRGLESIAETRRIPLDSLRPDRGEALYRSKCQTCHGEGGEGVHLGRLLAGPLWGDRSWNDGAGFARTYTLAGFLRRAMPYSTPGSLRDEEAQQIAAFITAQPRPRYAEKARDYPGTTPPPDAPR